MSSGAVLVEGIQVDEITRGKAGPLYRGRVRFSIRTSFDQSLDFEIPFHSSPNLDEALRFCLHTLELVGEQIAEAARQTALSIGHDLKDFRPDAS